MAFDAELVARALQILAGAAADDIDALEDMPAVEDFWWDAGEPHSLCVAIRRPARTGRADQP